MPPGGGYEAVGSRPDGSEADPIYGRRKSRCSCCCCCLCVFWTLFVLVAAVAGTYLVYGLFFGPFHAECFIRFQFAEPCPVVAEKLATQISEWGMDAPCGNGSRCYYSLVEDTPDILKASHVTYDQKFTDDLEFRWTNESASPDSCVADGFSESRVWYAILDFGTNFCNLWNLVEGAGLSAEPRFNYTTEDKICTMYSHRNCDKY